MKSSVPPVESMATPEGSVGHNLQPAVPGTPLRRGDEYAPSRESCLPGKPPLNGGYKRPDRTPRPRRCPQTARLWARHPPPYPDELFSSWLVRLAWANGLSYRTLVRLLWGPEPGATRDLDLIAYSLPLERLAAHTYLPSSEIRSLSVFGEQQDPVFRVKDDRGDSPWRFCTSPLGSVPRGLGRGGLPYCPDCLRGDFTPYIRRSWRYSLVFCCTYHGRFLETSCPRCATPLDHRDGDLDRASLAQCPECKADLSNSELPAEAPLRGPSVAHLATQKRMTETLCTGRMTIGGSVEVTLAEFLCFVMASDELLCEEWHHESPTASIRSYRDRLISSGLALRGLGAGGFAAHSPSIRAEVLTELLAQLDSCWPGGIAVARDQFRRTLRRFNWMRWLNARVLRKQRTRSFADILEGAARAHFRSPENSAREKPPSTPRMARSRRGLAEERGVGCLADFEKLALLRALTPRFRLGVCWNEREALSPLGGDEDVSAYLKERSRLRHLDPGVFEALSSLREDIAEQRRAETLTSVESLGLLRHNTLYFHETCPDSPTMRATWIARMAEALGPARLLYLDSEGGRTQEDCGRLGGSLDELSALRQPRRAILVYLGRINGGRKQRELLELVGGNVSSVGFSDVDAIVLRPHTLRCFLLLDAGAGLRARLAAFAERWRDEAWLYPRVV